MSNAVAPHPPRMLSPQEKHARARQSVAMARLGSVVFLMLVSLPMALTGLVIYLVIRKNKKRMAMATLAMLGSLGYAWFAWPDVKATFETIQSIVQTNIASIQAFTRKPTGENWQLVQPILATLQSHAWHIWLMFTPLAPILALQLEASRPKNVSEQRDEVERQRVSARKEKLWKAKEQVTKAPEQERKQAVIGVPIEGDLAWIMRSWAVYSEAMLNRHAVIVGGSGTGKTEFILRVAYLARKIYGWKVFYIDAKGDHDTAQRFIAAMKLAGTDAAMFPTETYNGWVGDAPTLLHRLMAVEDYSEPYYRSVAKTVIALALNAQAGPPRSSDAFLKRLELGELASLYEGEKSARSDALGSLTTEHVNGVRRRYFGFFDSLMGKLNSGWSFDSVDAGYILLDGLALKEEARACGRYLLEDFANYAAKRKRFDEKVLLIVDEFSAISTGGADAANLFERLRSYGAGIMVTAQTSEGLGEDAAKLIGAAAVTIAFQSADPDEIAARAGKVKEVQQSIATEYVAVPGRNTFALKKQHMLGTSTEREVEVNKLHADVIRRLQVGECCIIANGEYIQVLVARMPQGAKEKTKKETPSKTMSAVEITQTRRSRRHEGAVKIEQVEGETDEHQADPSELRTPHRSKHRSAKIDSHEIHEQDI